MYFFNLFIPRLGEVTRCTILAKYEKVPVEDSIGTMVLERLIDLICLMLLAGLLLLLEYDKIINSYDDLKAMMNVDVSPIIKYGVLAALIVGFIIFILYYIKKNGLSRLNEMLRQKVKNLIESILSIRKVEKPFLFIVYSVAIWICYLLMMYFIYKALPETSELSLASALFCLCFGALAVVATPGGIGVYPLVIQQILIIYGINSIIAGAFGQLAWCSQTLGSAIGGIISLILLNILNKDKTTGIIHESNS